MKVQKWKKWKKAQSKAYKKYYEKNKEKFKERARKYRENNKEKIKNNQKKYYEKEENRIKRRLSNRKRIERLKTTSDGTVTKNAILGMLEGQDRKCKLCKCDLLSDYHIDHIHPVSKGGAHSISNIQLLCPFCNLSKKDRIL